jgi:hypothetical protein
MDWKPIFSAPFDRNLQIAVIDRGGEHALVFPCRQTEVGWIDTATKRSVPVSPSHWREWDHGH